MTLSTSQLRNEWAPACTNKGPVYLDAYAALDAVFRLHGYRPTAPDCGAYSCRAITGGTGYSLHSYGPGDAFTFWTGLRIATSLAVDINWQDNPYGPRLVTDMPRAMVDDVLRIRTRNGQQVWRWGGDYRTNKDAMHFEIACGPRDLGTGIDQGTVAGLAPVKPSGWQPPPFPGTITSTSPAQRVAAWRMVLAAAGYRGFKVGMFPWSMTLGAATRRFQRNHGLVVDGIVGPKTWAVACQVLRKKRAKEKG